MRFFKLSMGLVTFSMIMSGSVLATEGKTVTNEKAKSLEVVGVWKTIDDKTNKAKSWVEIDRNDQGVFSGKIVKILDPKKAKDVCKVCSGEKKNKPVQGLEVIWGMHYKGDRKYSGGRVLDPESGKVYKAYLKLLKKDTLKVHGYIGIPLFGRSQTWYRVSADDIAKATKKAVAHQENQALKK